MPEQKAFCAECGGTMTPRKVQPQPAKKAATTVLTQRSLARRKQRPSKAEAAQRPGALTIYWNKRKRMDEE